MNTLYARISSKGQMVIPAELRKKLGIKAGTKVAVREENARLILYPITKTYIDAMQGWLGDTTGMIEQLHQERRKEDEDLNAKIRAGRQRSSRVPGPASRRASRKRSA